jgi:hypothetical protein
MVSLTMGYLTPEVPHESFQLIRKRMNRDELRLLLLLPCERYFGGIEIDCMIARDDCGGQRPHLTLTGGLRLVVSAEDSQRAAEFLRTEAEGP